MARIASTGTSRTKTPARRTRRIALGVAAIVASSLVVGPALGLDRNGHAFVRISQMGVSPEVLELESGRAIGWINRTSRVARVSFHRNVARHMVCESDMGFRLNGQQLESPRIQSRQFASLCQLEPGRYTYRVDLRSGAGAMGSPEPVRSFEGTLVVR